MARWTKMPHGMEVGLGPGDSVLVPVPSPPPEKRAQPHPIFGPCLLWPNGWVDQDVTCDGGKPRPRPHCVRWGLSFPGERGTATPPSFGPCLLWPRSPSQLLLSSCQNSVTDTLSTINISSHLKCVATLPCEMFVLKNRNDPELEKRTSVQASAIQNSCWKKYSPKWPNYVTILLHLLPSCSRTLAGTHFFNPDCLSCSAEQGPHKF